MEFSYYWFKLNFVVDQLPNNHPPCEKSYLRHGGSDRKRQLQQPQQQ